MPRRSCRVTIYQNGRWNCLQIVRRWTDQVFAGLHEPGGATSVWTKIVQVVVSRRSGGQLLLLLTSPDRYNNTGCVLLCDAIYIAISGTAVAYISPWVFVRTIALLHVHLTCLSNSYDYPRLVTFFSYISGGGCNPAIYYLSCKKNLPNVHPGLARRRDECSW